VCPVLPLLCCAVLLVHLPDPSCHRATLHAAAAACPPPIRLPARPPACLQVLCASNEAHDAVDPVNPPEGAAIGERITFAG
jgi:hypothetical protein